LLAGHLFEAFGSSQVSVEICARPKTLKGGTLLLPSEEISGGDAVAIAWSLNQTITS
jgi:hypothetical protein